jgi:tight adherence protein B
VTTGALLAAALAIVAWPDRRAEQRWRLGSQSGRWLRQRPPVDGVPVPMLAAATAAASAAALSTALVAFLAAVLAGVAARAWQGRRRADRLASRLRALTDGLGALAAELRSGRPLSAATDAAVAASGDEEGGRALARAVRAPAIAGPPEPARADEAVLADALGRISAAVVLSTRTGCSLAGVLSAVEDDLRARRRHREELRAATAGPAASALVLAGLPLLGLAMGSGVGADPWRVLTTTPTGQVLLVTGVGLELAGLAWSRRLVRRAVR